MRTLEDLAYEFAVKRENLPKFAKFVKENYGNEWYQTLIECVEIEELLDE